jgi:hypothetical protein
VPWFVFDVKVVDMVSDVVFQVLVGVLLLAAAVVVAFAIVYVIAVAPYVVQDAVTRHRERPARKAAQEWRENEQTRAAAEERRVAISRSRDEYVKAHRAGWLPMIPVLSAELAEVMAADSDRFNALPNQDARMDAVLVGKWLALDPALAKTVYLSALHQHVQRLTGMEQVARVPGSMSVSTILASMSAVRTAALV